MVRVNETKQALSPDSKRQPAPWPEILLLLLPFQAVRAVRSRQTCLGRCSGGLFAFDSYTEKRAIIRSC
eukprot:2298165-Pyramimonas_sp.AAC.1